MPDELSPSDRREYRIACWSGIYFCNLFVPFMFGQMICNTKYGITGMAAGVVICAMVSFYLVIRYRSISKSLCVGGIVIGLAQFFPLLQIIVGQICLELWKRLSGGSSQKNIGDTPVLQFFGSLFVTIQTGQILLLLAYIAGSTLRAIHRTIFGQAMVTAPDTTDDPES